MIFMFLTESYPFPKFSSYMWDLLVYKMWASIVTWQSYLFPLFYFPLVGVVCVSLLLPYVDLSFVLSHLFVNRLW